MITRNVAVELFFCVVDLLDVDAVQANQHSLPLWVQRWTFFLVAAILCKLAKDTPFFVAGLDMPPLMCVCRRCRSAIQDSRRIFDALSKDREKRRLYDAINSSSIDGKRRGVVVELDWTSAVPLGLLRFYPERASSIRCRLRRPCHVLHVRDGAVRAGMPPRSSSNRNGFCHKKKVSDDHYYNFVANSNRSTTESKSSLYSETIRTSSKRRSSKPLDRHFIAILAPSLKYSISLSIEACA